MGLRRERRAICEHMHALLKKIQHRQWEWQNDRRNDWVPGFFRYSSAFMASLDVKTAKPFVVSKILTHGHVVAGVAEMKDVMGSATQNVFGKEGWRQQCRGNVWPNMCRGKRRTSGRQGGG